MWIHQHECPTTFISATHSRNRPTRFGYSCIDGGQFLSIALILPSHNFHLKYCLISEDHEWCKPWQSGLHFAEGKTNFSRPLERIIVNRCSYEHFHEYSSTGHNKLRQSGNEGFIQKGESDTSKDSKYWGATRYYRWWRESRDWINALPYTAGAGDGEARDRVNG